MPDYAALLLGMVTGSLVAGLAMWQGWKLGYTSGHDATPPAIGGEVYEGAVLDYATYDDEEEDGTDTA